MTNPANDFPLMNDDIDALLAMIDSLPSMIIAALPTDQLRAIMNLLRLADPTDSNIAAAMLDLIRDNTDAPID